MAQVNFYLRSNATDRKSSVMVFFSYDGNRIKIGVVDHIDPKFWDSKNQRARQTNLFAGHSEFNSRLRNITDRALDVYRRFLNDNNQEQPTSLVIKQLITSDLFPSKKCDQLMISDLLGFIDLFIADRKSGKQLSERGGPIQPSTIKIYNTLKNNLLEFKKRYGFDLDWKNIGVNFFEMFKEYLTFEKDYRTNTLAKHIKTLKIVLNDAYERGLIKELLNGKRFKANTESTESIYLNESELEKIQNYDFSNKPSLERVRDLFLVGCWTGLRFSDFSTITSNSIEGDFIRLKTKKTGKEVVIPIHQVVKTVMEKYAGKTESSLPPSISNQKMNQYLKEIGKIAGIGEVISQKYTKGGRQIERLIPKYLLISSHTARRSFATNMYLDGVTSINIMAITGHTTESSFMKYIRVTPVEYAVKLKHHWEAVK